MPTTLTLEDQVTQLALLTDGELRFEGKTAGEWMQAMVDAEDAGAPERVANRAYRISCFLDCLADTSEE